MRAGKLRHKIKIEENTPTRGAAGSYVEAWATFTTIRAEITNKVGTEVLESGRVSGKRAVVFICRYYPGVTTQMRVNYDSRQFDIVDVDNMKELNRKMVLTCTEVV